MVTVSYIPVSLSLCDLLILELDDIHLATNETLGMGGVRVFGRVVDKMLVIVGRDPWECYPVTLVVCDDVHTPYDIDTAIRVGCAQIYNTLAFVAHRICIATH